MKPNRRDLLKLISWAASLPLFSPFIDKALAQGSAEEHRAADAIAFFKAQGYRENAPLDLITGAAFNGGVRYDETMPSLPTGGKTFYIQDCIRVDDIPMRDDGDVLPYFHILSLNTNIPSPRMTLLVEVLEYLTNHVNLDASRIVFVSTDIFAPYLPELAPFGIADAQFVARDRKDALSAGDGSGYFAPKGHPDATPYHTASIHYAPSAAAMQNAPSYPLPGFLELGEIVIHENAAEIVDFQIAALGVERLSMAAGRSVESFTQSRDMALAALEEESKRRKLPLPPAYDTLKSA